jgi:cyclic pyranopterin phosphate synthase
MADRVNLKHVTDEGRASMVDIGGKKQSIRLARAEATVHLGYDIAEMLKRTGSVAKGNVIETARIAGIMAAKRTSDLIPMCHPIPIDVIEIDIWLEGINLKIIAAVRCRASTGVEMEAMTAAAVAALTVYDMCKSAGKGITIGRLRLLEKSGGESGYWSVEEGDDG